MQLLHDNFFIAGQLTAKDFITAKELGISMIINNRPDGEESGILSVSEAQKLAAENNIQYLYLPMANGKPLPEDLIPNMQLALSEQHESRNKVLAHCRTGTRSSFLWGAVQIIEGKKNVQEIITICSESGINLTGFAPFLQGLES